MSLWSAVGGLAAAVGPSLGSFVVDSIGWPSAFFINLPLGALSLWRGSRLLREARADGSSRPMDLVGVGLVIAAVDGISLAIVQSNAPTWTRSQVAGTALSGVAALAAFVVWMRTARVPLVDPRLFRHRTYTFANLATLSFGVAFSMMFFTFFFYMTEVWHYSLPRAGLAITPGPLLVVLVAVLSGRVAGRIGHRPFLVGGSLLYAGSGLWFMIVPGLKPQYMQDGLPGMVLGGVAIGLVLPSLSAAAVNRLPVHDDAVGSAVDQSIRQIGSVLGVALTVLLLAHAGVTRSDFTAVYACYIGLALLTAALCLPIDTRPDR